MLKFILSSRYVSLGGWIVSLTVLLGCGSDVSRQVEPDERSPKTRSLQPETQTGSESQDDTLAQEEVKDPLDGLDGRELALRNFRPHSRLRVKSTPLTMAKFPVVDVHTHFRLRTRHSDEMLRDFVNLMDRNQIAVCVSLDGQLGTELDAHLHYLWSDFRDRFVVFANIGWIGSGDPESPATWACHQEDFVRRTIMDLEAAQELGISGVKIFKQFGLGYRNPDGSLLTIDDARWDPIWETCGRLNLPILIHTADPAAFFDPIDANNERWEELSRHPDWSFHGDEFPSRQELLDARNRIIERHPHTKFIAAHVANNSEDLATVAEWLDEYPNMYVEFASRIGELGRQPYTARDFLIEYQDRVLFGTDGPWPETRIHYYWRFLETFDEYFPYSEKAFPPQGFWNIYGVGLPEEVLQKIYLTNAAKVVPGVRERLQAWEDRDPE